MPPLKLSKVSTKAPAKLDKDHTKADTQKILEELDELQNLLFAEHKHSLLVVLQGMDASGKDGVIRNVFGKLNPQGVQVYSFKAPTDEEKNHDFLWRIHKVAPGKGNIVLFNRSHYEDVLVQRVHKWIDKPVVKKRFAAINDFERMLEAHNDTRILKFYLHISPEEQQQRLKERMQDPRKMWKYNANDFEEAKLWDEYRKAYDDVFEQCNEVPWTIVPADQNWYKEYVIAKTVRDTLVKLKMAYPGLKKSQ
ncbi:polyphosphate kinase [Chitinophaga sedimenti]|uniref:PPK2 family polyphosphate kinase n=1 Tax=Chitinophaga sedimenti TaxID=2033606 RepID=UPI002005256E|nr:PPK2 family polyphosphate kinase [Chitinophaga sedimenti]MCK7559013.1 polyphosphate kinase [Chitinophaga sedimenti]